MVNHDFRYIYISVPKTGTSSIICAIEPDGFEREPGRKHRTISQIEEEIPGEQFNQYFKFGYVRNPWDLTLSFYQYIIGKKGHFLHEQLCQYSSFSECLKNVHVPVAPQLSYFTNSTDNIIVDYIGRFENLQQDFDIICDRIGRPQQQLPHRNKTDHKHYTEYYDDETRQMVAERYAKDIEYFGYKFGE
jgi:hypothetical protein